MSRVHQKIEVESFKIEPPTKEAILTEPFVRITLDGDGCSEPGCACSPGNYVTLSDGKVGLMVALTPSQAKQLREHGTLWLDGEGAVGRNALEAD